MSNTNPARGMRDFLPTEVRKREYVIGIIKEVYQKYGFEPLETPSVENLETLTGKYGEEGNQLIFKILKRRQSFSDELDHFVDLVNDKYYDDDNPHYPPDIEKSFSDLALRYDLTVPLARVVANNKNDLPKFFKRYQIQPVWRADRPARGRYREFYQCDVDAIGSKSMVVEAELISAVCEILQKLGFEDFVIRMNHRQLLREMLDASGVAENLQTDALVAIDKLDKIGVEGVKKELVNRQISESSADKILNFFNQINDLTDNNLILNSLIQFIGSETNSLKEIRQVLQITQNQRLRIDASLARGLSYYTGSILEINVPDLAGSLAGGGRYDGLIGMFGKEEIPACGFSLGLERILIVMEERGMFPPELNTNSADVMVTIWNEESIAESLKLANELRQIGLRVTVYPEADKLGKQFKYASSINVPFVCVLGEIELAEGKVTIKNLASGQQELVNRNELKGYFATI